MRCLFLSLCFLLSMGTVVFGAAYDSNGTGGGNWSVGASWNPVGVPGAGDTVHILAGDTINIDGNITIGSTPGNDTTYDVDIDGTLQWPANPGASWTLTFSTSVNIGNGGKFQIGTGTGARLDCDYKAKIVMDTNGNPDYDIKVEDGAELNWYGCESWRTSGSEGERARISACDASPCNGAVTLTMDRDVDWDDCNGDADFCAVLVGVGGNVSTGAGANSPIEVTSYTNVDANEISLTLANTHQIGDMVVKVSRNILIHSNSATSHGVVYSTGGKFYLSWARLDEMGDGTSTGAGGAAINFSDTSKNLGTLEYLSVTNCEDGGGTYCARFSAGEWDTVSNFYGYDYYTGACMGIDGLYDDEELTDLVCINEETTERGSGLYSTNLATGVLLDIDGAWTCKNVNGLYASNAMIGEYIDCVSHSDNKGIYHQDGGGDYVQNDFVTVKDGEFRNCASLCISLQSGGPSLVLDGNDFDSSYNAAVHIDGGTIWVEAYDNTYDNCNTHASDSYGVFHIDDVEGGYYYGQNEDFGSTTANNKANFLYNAPQYNDQFAGQFRGVCNNCILTSETGANWAWPIFINDGTAGFQRNTFINHHSYFTLHNVNQVEGDHWGWGPGGMIIERDTAAPPSGAWVDESLYLKVTPGSAQEYHRVPLGIVHVESGESVTVDLQIQKDEAQADGRRPRLSLQGAGFIPFDDYDEMPNTQNTWESVQVTGISTYAGAVHIYLEVKNEYSGAANKEPVWPATLEIYADAIDVSH